jgi:hypothetical protein
LNYSSCIPIASITTIAIIFIVKNTNCSSEEKRINAEDSATTNGELKERERKRDRERKLFVRWSKSGRSVDNFLWTQN